MDSLFCCLHTEWKKNNEGRKLEKLLINSDDEPCNFQSLLESTISTHMHLITKVAKTVEVYCRDKKVLSARCLML